MSAENQVESKASSLIGLRPPQEVATLACMGAAHPHRLSFMRLLLRRAKREGWTFSRRVWECDADGYGTAVYTANGPEHCYSLIAFRIISIRQSARIVSLQPHGMQPSLCLTAYRIAPISTGCAPMCPCRKPGV